MYFSAKEFYDYATRNQNFYNGALWAIRVELGLDSDAPVSLKQAQKGLAKIKEKLRNRQAGNYSKWYRPWEVVPKLKEFRAPEGDYGVGVEVELGFVSLAAARQVANHVQHWKYITLDFEGGSNPIELTFPPIPYSVLNKRSQVIRYLDYLNVNSHLVHPHAPGRVAGTHVNVSCGSVPIINIQRCGAVNSMLWHLMGYDPNYGWDSVYTTQTAEHRARATKYFGRRPYGWGYPQGGGRWIEWKLFHSTIDSKRFIQYANVAVALTRLICGTDTINEASVLQALEDGYTGNIRKLIKADKEAARSSSAVSRPRLAA